MSITRRFRERAGAAIIRVGLVLASVFFTHAALAQTSAPAVTPTSAAGDPTPAAGVDAQPAPLKARRTPSPSNVPAIHLSAATIKIDGVGDEAVWKQAAYITGLTSYDPVEGNAPVSEVEARVFYDDDALYVSARIYEAPGTMRGRVSAREIVTSDDVFEVMLDPFFDRRTGYDFTVTPYNVQTDWTIIDDNWSSAWDGVWTSATRTYNDGFSVEMRIPFRTLRFSPKDVQDWGIGLGVFTGDKKQYDKWPSISQNAGTMYSQLAVLKGLRGVSPGHNIDIIPTLMFSYGGDSSTGPFAWYKPQLASLRDPAIVSPGLDARFGVTASTNVNLTLNPDYSQVEADQDQLTYNLRYPISLVEKRPFFLEANDTFATPVPLLYTRSIIDPLVGTKVTGHEGSVAFGFLSIYDQLPQVSRLGVLAPQLGNVPVASGFEDTTGRDAVNTIGRVNVDVAQGARVGLFVADKSLIDRATGKIAVRNDVVSADTLVTFASVYTATGQVGASDVARPTGKDLQGAFYDVVLRRRDKQLLLQLENGYYGPDFRAEMSPLARVNIIPTTATGSYRFYTNSELVPFVEPGLVVSTLHDPTTGYWLDGGFAPTVATRFGNNTDVRLTYSTRQETYIQTFRPISLGELTIDTNPWSFLRFGADLQYGEQIHYSTDDLYLGRLMQGSFMVAVQALKHAELQLKYTKSLFFRPNPLSLEQNVDLFYAKLNISLTPQWSFRGISQVDTYQMLFSNSLLLDYQVYPGTEVYLGATSTDAFGTVPPNGDFLDLTPADRRIFLKFSYRWQL